jgi:hypothetical protein
MEREVLTAAAAAASAAASGTAAANASVNASATTFLPLWIRLLLLLHRILFSTIFHPRLLSFVGQLGLMCAAFLYANQTNAIAFLDEKVTERIRKVLRENVFPESEEVTLKKVKFRWNRVEVFDVQVGNCRSSSSSSVDDDDDDDGEEKEKENSTTTTEEEEERTEKKKNDEFSSPYVMRIQQISFRCSFFTLVPMMQFFPDKNFAVGFLSAKIDLMEARGVDIYIEEWRGRGNFRVFKKKKKNKREWNFLKASETNALLASEGDEALTKDGNSGGANSDTLFSYFQSQVQTQIEDANKKIQDAANKTIEISGSVVKEIGSMATDVTDKLTALGRYATMINTMQEDPIETMQKRPLVLRVKETRLIDWNVRILTVSQTSFKVKQFEMDKVFVGTGKAFGKHIAQGVLQRIIVEFQDESLNLITNGVSDGFMKSKKFLDDGLTTVYDGVKKTTQSGAKLAAKTMENARSTFTARTIWRGDVDPHELTPTGSVTTTSSHLGDDDDEIEKNNKDSIKYELFPDKNNSNINDSAADPHEMQQQQEQQKSAASASDLFGLGNLFSTCSPGGNSSGRKKQKTPPPAPAPPTSTTTLGKPESPPQP